MIGDIFFAVLAVTVIVATVWLALKAVRKIFKGLWWFE